MTSIELRSQFEKKYTANGLVRRGRPLTSQTAFGGLRPAGPSGPIFDERRTTYDERLFRPQCTICEIFFLLFMGELRTIGLYLLKYQCKGRG